MGSICINQSSNNNKDMHYPIIKKQLQMSPNRQCVLEKPLIHSELFEDTQDLTQLESILEDIVLNKQIDDDKITNEQITVKQERLEQVRIKEIVEMVTQNINRVVTQTRVKLDSKEESSVIRKMKQGGLDTQTIKSILKTSNKSQSQKSINRMKEINRQKKVTFGSHIQKQKINKFFK